jgi:hypothetical protein
MKAGMSESPVPTDRSAGRQENLWDRLMIPAVNTGYTYGLSNSIQSD